MSDKVSLVRVLTAATGNSTPITLGARYSDLFMTPADAGAVDGRTYTWLIVDGNNWELVKGVYTASGTTAARTTVLASRSAGTLGTSRIVLSGTAQVRIVESSYDMDGIRGTRVAGGTSDTLAATDLGYVVAYTNTGAVAVSLAQAGTAALYDGWATTVFNYGLSTVTITPATSTINSASTLAIPSGMGAFIWSLGSNYNSYMLPITKPLLAANNLADVASAGTARGNIGSTAIGDALFIAASAAAARTTLGSTTVGDAVFTAASAAAAQVAIGSPYVLLNTLTASNSATLSDTTSLTSTFSAYDIVLENLVPVNSGVSCALQVHSGGSFQSTSYTANELHFSGGAMVTTAQTSFIPCSSITNVANAVPGVAGTYRIYTPSLTTTPKHWTGQYSHVLTGGGVNVGGLASGFWNSNAAVDGFQVIFSSGNIASGVVKIYGIK